jgi:3-oxoadipate enol-lactonase
MLLAYDDEGAGRAVLLLHAGVADRRMWDVIAPAMSHAFRVVRPDLRGFGETPMPPGEYADADDLDQLFEQLGIVDAAVVGSSFGGRVALELASLHPGRVSSLVLLAPALRGLEPTADLVAFSEEEDRLLNSDDIDGAVDLNVRTWLGPEADDDAKSLVRLMQRRALDVQRAADASEPGPQPRVVEVDPATIAVPTVVVAGDHDLDHFRLVAGLLADRIPGAELVTLPWAGHLPSLERPGAILALLLDVVRDDPTVHAP